VSVHFSFVRNRTKATDALREGQLRRWQTPRTAVAATRIFSPYLKNMSNTNFSLCSWDRSYTRL